MSTVHSLCPCMYMRLLNDQNAFRLKFFHFSILIRQKKRTKKTHTLQSNYACESCASCCAIQQTITLFLITFRFLCSLFLRQTIFQVYKSIRVKVICVISSIFFFTLYIMVNAVNEILKQCDYMHTERKKERKKSKRLLSSHYIFRIWYDSLFSGIFVVSMFMFFPLNFFTPICFCLVLLSVVRPIFVLIVYIFRQKLLQKWHTNTVKIRPRTVCIIATSLRTNFAPYFSNVPDAI